MRGFVVAVGVVCTMGLGLATVVIGCNKSDVSCAAGTHLVGNMCLPDDMGSTESTDMAVTVCGANETETNGVCVLAASACQGTGTTLDPATNTCKNVSYGTQLASANFIHGYQHIRFVVPDGGTPDTDMGVGTDKLVVVGNLTAVTASPPPTSSTVLVNSQGKPIGGGTYLGIYPIDVPRPTPTALDPNYQLTFGDWQKCAGSVSWYKPDAKVNGKAVYKQVVDVTQCTPNSLYTVWLFWTPDGTRASSVAAAPSGGLPNVIQTNDDGNGHFERFIDSDVWFKYGQSIPFAGAHVSPPTVPAATNTNAGVITVLIYHFNQQTNGNAGWTPWVIPSGGTQDACKSATSCPCVQDPNNPGFCQNPQPANAINLGQTGFDSAHQLLHEPGVNLSLLQPY